MAKTKSEKVGAATVEVLESLTADESRERHRLELKVDNSLGSAWSALKQLRERRLYRSTDKTFEEYAKRRFGYNRAHAYRLIAAACVLENLSPIWRQNESDDEMSPNWRQKLPSSESQCRELAKLPPQQQPMAWEKVLETSRDEAPTAKLVKSVVETFKEKPSRLASDFCEVGDVFILTKLEGIERKYNGCWAIASNTHGITVGIDVHDRSLRVKPENLKPIDSPEIHRTLPVILKRIRRLRNSGMLDRCAYTILESLGRQTYLTDFEDKLLTFMEQEHGISEYSSTDSY